MTSPQPIPPPPSITYPLGPPGAQDAAPYPMWPNTTTGPDGTQQVPQYPPYIPESQFNTSSGMPRSTLDGIHGSTGDEPVRWSPSSPGELPPYWMHDYVQDHGDPGLWWPDNRPAPPGQTQPAARHDNNRDEKKPDQSGVGDAQLNVNPADLNNVSDQYAELQARAAAISPQAVEEVNRIIASHGAMGYPVAVGVVAGLARRQARLQAQTAQFGVYSARFTEHAATYTTEDAEAAARISDIDFGPAAVSTPGAVAG